MKLLINVSKVPLNLSPVGEALVKVKVLVDFFNPKLVNGDIRIDTSTGVNVLSPNTTNGMASLKSLDLEAKLSELVNLVNAAKAATDDNSIIVIRSRHC